VTVLKSGASFTLNVSGENKSRLETVRHYLHLDTRRVAAKRTCIGMHSRRSSDRELPAPLQKGSPQVDETVDSGARLVDGAKADIQAWTEAYRVICETLG